LLLIATTVAYFPALRGGMVWDDDAHITAPELRPLAGLGRIWTVLGSTQQYYPVLHSAFWVEHRLWGDAMLGYHLTNVLLHVLAAGLVVAAMRRLALPGAWLGGFLFALHPVAVESVAWISEQKNTLSAVFYLSAGLAYLRFDQRRQPAFYWLALGCYVLALLTKTVTATLPAALLVIFWWQRGRLSWRRDLGPLLPWLALGVAAGAFTAWVEWTFIGAHGAAFTLSTAQRILIAGRALGFYVGKLAWPVNLIFIYPRWQVDPRVAWQWLYPLGALMLMAMLVWLSRAAFWGCRGLLAGALFFAGTLFPVLGAFNVYPFIFSFVADHFQYLARLGVLVPVAAGLTRWADTLAANRRFTLGVILVGALGVLTWRDSRDYRDADTLNRATLVRNPGSWLSHYNLGVSLEHQSGGLAEAVAEYQATVEIEPGFADAHNNLGGALWRWKGDRDGALAEYRTALRLRPDDARIHSNLANLLALVPETRPEAIAEFRTALRLDPALAEAHFNLANELAKDPRSPSEAIAHYRAALQIRPSYAGAYQNLGILLAGLPDRLPEAIAALRSSLRLEPANARFHQNLGIVLERMPGQTADARAELETALRLDPELPNARAHLDRLRSLHQ
jgi:tetratricopeptide (TPR) repeat protein